MEKFGLRAAGAEQQPQRGPMSALMQGIPASQTPPRPRWAPGRWDGSGGLWEVAGYRQHSQVTFVRALENALAGWNAKPHFPGSEGILEISTLPYHCSGCRSTGTSSCAALQGQDSPFSPIPWQWTAPIIPHGLNRWRGKPRSRDSTELSHEWVCEIISLCPWFSAHPTPGFSGKRLQPTQRAEAAQGQLRDPIQAGGVADSG